jgi:hypothetical protein
MKIKISQLFRDPALKAIFEKVERDQGQTPAELDRKPKAPRLRDGAAAAVQSKALELA